MTFFVSTLYAVVLILWLLGIGPIAAFSVWLVLAPLMCIVFFAIVSALLSAGTWLVLFILSIFFSDMKPFNLEAAKAGKPLVTRGGSLAKLIAHVPEANEGTRVLALVGSEIVTYFETGQYWNDSETTGRDLFMATEKKTVYVNLLQPGFAGHVSGWQHDTEQSARQSAADNPTNDYQVIAVPVEIEV